MAMSDMSYNGVDLVHHQSWHEHCQQGPLHAEDDSLFLHGLLEGIARIECEAYNLLKQLGATPVTKVTCITYLHLQAVCVCIHAHAQPGEHADLVVEPDEDNCHVCMSWTRSYE